MTGNNAFGTGDAISVVKRPAAFDIGPRPGWWTAIGAIVLGVSLITWVKSQAIIISLMNGGSVSESTATATLETLRNYANAGVVIGSVFSIRLAVAAIQLLLAGSIRLQNAVVSGYRSETPGLSDWRHQRFASGTDPGGLTQFLLRIQRFLAGIPNQTAALVPEAAVFLWAAVSSAARFAGRAIAAPAIKVGVATSTAVNVCSSLVGRVGAATRSLIGSILRLFAGWFATLGGLVNKTVVEPIWFAIQKIAFTIAIPFEWLLRFMSAVAALGFIGIIVLGERTEAGIKFLFGTIAEVVALVAGAVSTGLAKSWSAIVAGTRFAMMLVVMPLAIAGSATWTASVALVTTGAHTVAVAGALVAGAVSAGAAKSWSAIVAGTRFIVMLVVTPLAIAGSATWVVVAGVYRFVTRTVSNCWNALAAAVTGVASGVTSAAVYVSSQVAAGSNALAGLISTEVSAAYNAVRRTVVYTARLIAKPVVLTAIEVRAGVAALARLSGRIATFLWREASHAVGVVVTALKTVIVPVLRTVATAVGTTGGWFKTGYLSTVAFVRSGLVSLGRAWSFLSRQVHAAVAGAWHLISSTAESIARHIVEILGFLTEPFTRAFVDIVHAIPRELGILKRGMVGAVKAIARFIAMPFVEIGRIAKSTAVIIALIVARPFKEVWLGFVAMLDSLRIIWRLMKYLLRLPGKAVRFTASSIVEGVGAIPDGVRLSGYLIQNGGRNMSTSQINMPRERALRLIGVLWLLGIGGFLTWIIVDPGPPPPTVEVVHWTTGHLTREGLLFDMEKEFNDAQHTTADGTLIKVTVFNVPSEMIGTYLSTRIRTGQILNMHEMTNGYVREDIVDPTIVTPSSAHWLSSTNYEIGLTGRPEVVDLEAAEPIVRPVIGIVTYRDMAMCLGWPTREVGFQDIIDLRTNGWGSMPCAKPSWGTTPLLAYTDPVTSSTGRSLLLSLYAMAAAKEPQALTLADVTNDSVVRYVKDFQALIDHYENGTMALNTKVVGGPEYGQFFIMPEDNLIHLLEGTETATINGKKVSIKDLDPPFNGDMVMIYPKEGAMPRNNCACIVNADWVSEQQVEASHQWIDFIRDVPQQRKFMSAGFRPGIDMDMNVPESKITAQFGLNPQWPKKILNPSFTPPEVTAKIDEQWVFVKKPGIIEFVIDTSASMLGNPLEQAQDGVERALDSMAINNHVGLMGFSSMVNTEIPISQLDMDGHGASLIDASRGFKASGETAMYDALAAAIRRVDESEGDENAIRGVVLMTDGKANQGSLRLYDLVRMTSTFETEIRWSGWSNEPPPVPAHTVIGDSLLIPTRHKIQVFFIGVGDEADMDVGRVLAQATGGSYIHSTEDDLAQVLEDFSHYF